MLISISEDEISALLLLGKKKKKKIAAAIKSHK